MSRVDSLIARLCPGGVSFCELGDLLDYEQPTRYLVSSTAYDGSYATPVLTAGQTFILGFTSESVGIFPASRDEPVIIFDDFTTAFRWVDFPFKAKSSAMKMLRPRPNVKVDFRFVFYAMLGIRFTPADHARHWISQYSKFRVPVPPLEVQREIVKVLNGFTELEANLETELEAELEARRRQYEHYRQVIFDRVDTDAVALSTLGQWRGGFTPSKSNPAFWESGTIPWLASMDVSDTSTDEIRGRVTQVALHETSLRLVPAPSVAVVMRSNILRRVLPIGLVKVATTVNQDLRVLVPREGVDAEYVYQMLRADSERIRAACVRTDGSMAAVDSQSLFSWTIPLPSLDEQRTVAETLRHLDALVNDLSIALPAELKARRQQYEHYRDRLLTFPEAA